MIQILPISLDTAITGTTTICCMYHQLGNSIMERKGSMTQAVCLLLCESRTSLRGQLWENIEHSSHVNVENLIASFESFIEFVRSLDRLSVPQ